MEHHTMQFEKIHNTNEKSYNIIGNYTIQKKNYTNGKEQILQRLTCNKEGPIILCKNKNHLSFSKL